VLLVEGTFDDPGDMFEVVLVVRCRDANVDLNKEEADVLCAIGPETDLFDVDLETRWGCFPGP
jgi:hypothetical protein